MRLSLDDSAARDREGIALVLGAGGAVGGAWLAGVLAETARATGWEPGTADVTVGTSAGAVMAGMLASGVPAVQLLPGPVGARDWLLAPLLRPGALSRVLMQSLAPGSPRLLRGILRRASAWARMTTALAALAPRGRAPTAVIEDTLRRATATPARRGLCWIVATDYVSGRRCVFGSGRRRDIARAAAASCAIPGHFQPVAIAGRDYVDGGILSPTNADLLCRTGIRKVLILNPLAGRGRATSWNPVARLENLIRNAAARQVEAEVALLRRRGLEVVLVEPGPQVMDTMGLDPLDATRCADVAEASVLETRARLKAGVLVLPHLRTSHAARPSASTA